MKSNHSRLELRVKKRCLRRTRVWHLQYSKVSNSMSLVKLMKRIIVSFFIRAHSYHFCLGILKESRSSAAEFLRKGKSSAVGFNGEVEIMEAKNPIETGASSERILQLLDKSRDFEYEWPTLGKVYVEPSKPDTRQSRIFIS